MSKRICVVLKADPEIGTGHLMRVKGLLPVLSDAGYELMLVSDSLHETLLPLCSEYSIIQVVPKAEISFTVNTINPALTLFDHYFLGAETEAQVKSPVAVIDDLMRDHNCALLTDSCFFRTEDQYQGHVPLNCRLLTGAQYSLIRSEFCGIERMPRAKPRVLINYGGADPAHACMKAVQAVLEAGLQRDFDFTVLSGISNPDHEILAGLLKTYPEIELLRNTSEVGKLFARCDLAMGAYGGMLKERMCAGLPCLGTVIASNQRGSPEIIRRLEVGIDIPLEELDKPDEVTRKLRLLNEKKDIYIQNGLKAVSGNGITLVSRSLIELAQMH